MLSNGTPRKRFSPSHRKGQTVSLQATPEGLLIKPTRVRYTAAELNALDPTLGTEIQGQRPVLILSNAETNRQGRAVVAPITQGGNLDRVRGWATSLMGSGTKTQGPAIISQARFLDDGTRRAKYVETTSIEVIADAMARLQAALDAEPM